MKRLDAVIGCALRPVAPDPERAARMRARILSRAVADSSGEPEPLFPERAAGERTTRRPGTRSR